LKTHPGSQIINRERHHEYPMEAAESAPVIQVADRWHLIKNWREALEIYLDQNLACRMAAAEDRVDAGKEVKAAPPDILVQDTLGQEPVSEPHSLSWAEKEHQRRRAKLLSRYESVIELHFCFSLVHFRRILRVGRNGFKMKRYL
jgi:hypothetical protein